MNKLTRVLFFMSFFLFLFTSSELKAEIMNNGLEIDKVFQLYGKKRNVTMVELSNEMLDIYNMKYYRSISIKDDAEALKFVRQCLEKDQQGARKIKEVVDAGGVVSAYYQLSMTKEGQNRFILFNLNTKKLITLVYLEGDLESDDLITLLLSI